MKKKILIAEDNKVISALYREAFPDQICELQIVNNGEQALSACKDWNPDILLLDYNMPVLNGYQVLKNLRTKGDGKTTTVIMVTSSSSKDDIVACAKLGIQGYIVKPFKTREIALKVFQLYKDHQQKLAIA
jgi:CheY-like chemotaxis protein